MREVLPASRPGVGDSAHCDGHTDLSFIPLTPKPCAPAGLIWDHAFSPAQLGVDPTECRILLTDPAMNPTANRQRMLEVMFEKYGFAGANMQIQAVLTLYAQGLLTGLVVDSGDGVSHAVAVVDGYAFPHQVRRKDTRVLPSVSVQSD
jgi:hypothetical protein